MSTVAKKPKATTSKPAHKADLLDPVVWYEGGTRQGSQFGGFVTAFGMGTSVNISLVQPNLNNLTTRDGVKHIDDPTLRPEEKHDNGAWDYTPRLRALMDLINELSAPASNPVANPPKTESEKTEPAK